jgi:hypothetical protein
MARERPARWLVITRVGILLGLVLLIAGFVVRDIRGRTLVGTQYVVMGLWIAGAVLAVGGAALNYKMFVDAFRRRRAAEGLNFAVTVVLALGLAGLLCFISTRRFARLDWTGTRTYSLHSKTVNVLRGLDRDVEATIVFEPSDDPLVERAVESTRDMLDEFKAVSRHVTVREVNWMEAGDRQRWEELHQRIGGEDVPNFAVVFTTAESHEAVPLGKIVSAPFGQVEFSGEDAFASALTKLTEAKRATVYFLTGHGERPTEAEGPGPMPENQPGIMSGPEYSLSRFSKALQKDNYELKPLNLAAGGPVPEDCAALVIAAPKTPFSDAETRALKAYFDERNGSALVLLDPKAMAGGSTNLPDLLGAYGVRPHTEALGISNFRTGMGGIQSPDVVVLPDGMAEHPITRDLKNYTLVLHYVCPLEIVQSPGMPPKAQKLLSGPAGPEVQNWGEADFRPDSSSEAQYTPGRDVPPPLVVAAVVAPQTPEAGPMPPELMGPTSGPKLVIIGSSLSFVNAALDKQPANLYLLMNSINWMAGKLHMLGIPPKPLEFNQVGASDSQVAAARYLFIGILPACIIVLGIGVWVMRRR